MKIKKLISSNKWDEIYKLLKKEKINAHKTILNGNTIAHIAAINNKQDIVRYLLNNDYVALEKSNNEGNSAVHLLAMYGYTDLLKECINTHKNYIDIKNNNNDTIFHYLYNDLSFLKSIPNSFLITNNDQNENIITKNIDESNKKKDNSYTIIKYLLNNNMASINNYPDSFLCYAIGTKKIHIANLFIKNGYDVNKKDARYITPFLYAIQEGNHLLLNRLIKAGSDVNYAGPEGDHNPLIYAIKKKDIILINLLLDNGFNINSYNRYLETPLHYALNHKTLSPSIISKLIFNGNLNIANIKGETPLHLLLKNHNWTNYEAIIRDKELDIFIEDKTNKKPLDYINGNYIFDFLDVVVTSYTKQLDGNLPVLPNCTDLNSDSCKNELKKYIFKTKRSIPHVEDSMYLNNKVIMVNGNHTNIGVFNSDSVHNVIYTIMILKNYKNLSIPFQYYSFDKFMNDQIFLSHDLYTQPHEYVISDLIRLYTNYFYEISPYLILWYDKNVNYVNKHLKFYLKKCISNRNIRFILLKLTLIISGSNTHANILIYDKKNNTLERFEPYGIVPYLNVDDLDRYIENIGKSVIDGKLTYLSPKDLFESIGPQVISGDNKNDNKNLGDPSGFCLAWTFWYVEMRVNNPDIHPKELITKMMGNINDKTNDKKFISFIRDYAFKLNGMKDEFMKFAGVDENNIYQLSPNNIDQKKIINAVKSELNSIIKSRSMM